jgi:arginyl-tRNA synthetase
MERIYNMKACFWYHNDELRLVLSPAAVKEFKPILNRALNTLDPKLVPSWLQDLSDQLSNVYVGMNGED